MISFSILEKIINLQIFIKDEDVKRPKRIKN